MRILKEIFKRDKEKFVVPKLDNEIGDTVVFDKVLLADEDGKITVGTPFISKAAVLIQS